MIFFCIFLLSHTLNVAGLLLCYKKRDTAKHLYLVHPNITP